MSKSINSVQLLGYLGEDPHVHMFQNGDKVINLRLATSETWRDRNSGERREKTEWHSVSILHQGFAKVAEQYLSKGSRILVEGKLQTRKWQDQNGNDRYSTEIVLIGPRADLTLLDGKPHGDQRGDADEGPLDDEEPFHGYDDEIPY